MPTYDPSNHWLLSDAAAKLEPQKLAAHADAAEAALGLVGTSFTGAQADRAKIAVVHWINCQLPPDDGTRRVKSRSESRGGQSKSVTYDDAKPADPCAEARRIARELLGVGRATTAQPNAFAW